MCTTNSKIGKKTLGFPCSLVLLTTFLCLFSTEKGWTSGEDHSQGGKYCSKTAHAALKACRNELKDDYWIAVGNCNNVWDKADRKECLKEANADWREARPECREQLEARLDICYELGEDPYDPDLSPAHFMLPEDIHSGNANRYFPLVVGNTWTYVGETEEGLEEIIVTVTEDTREIEYPADSGQMFNCVVIQDVVTLDGVLIEDTFDWYAQDLDGNVWYFGEIAKNYEDGELVNVEGSWESGRDSAKPGIIMFADPQIGDFYRQEFALGDAEDMGAVESRGEAEVTVEAGYFAEDVLETRDFTPIEPDVLELKYYAPGVGLVLELDPESGDQVDLVSYELTP